MLQEFRGLVRATVELCSQLEYSQIVRECSLAFESIMNEDQTGAAGGMDEEFTIDIEKFRFVHGVIMEVGVDSGNEGVSSRSKLVEEMMTKVY